MVPRLDGDVPRRDRIVSGDSPRAPSRLSFSWQYWRQIRFFGLDKTETPWLIDLMGRLAALCEMTRDQWNAQAAKGSDAWRYHKVKWDKRAVPIQRRDLDWLPKSILENEDEFPIFQFSVGTGSGRFAGFWENEDRFAIVLLDPHHNLQPAGDYNYRVDECAAQSTSAEVMQLAVDAARAKLKCAKDECDLHRELAQISVHKNVRGAYHFHETVSVGLEHGDLENLAELLKHKETSITAVVKKGIDVLTTELLANWEDTSG